MRRGLLQGNKFLCSKEVDLKVWGLFQDLDLSLPEHTIAHISEIVDQANDGAISMDRPFNLYGYDWAIKTNRKRKAIRKLRKETFIDFSGSNKDEKAETAALGGVNIDLVSYTADALSDARSEYDMLFDNEELKCAIETIKTLNEDFIVEYSVDLVSLIKKAVKGIPQAVVKLREVCDNMSCVAEQIKVVLTSGVPIEECFE